MIKRAVLALLILAFSWSQVGAHDYHDDYYDHHHDNNNDDWEEAYAWVALGTAVAGLIALGIILCRPPRPHYLLEESQQTPRKMIFEGGPTGIRIRF